MTLRAIGIQIRAGALLQRSAQIGQRRKLRKTADASFIKGRIEQPQPVQGAELIVGHSRARISKIAVELPRLDSQHVAGRRGMAGQAIGAAGIVPGLRADTAGVGDDDILTQAAGQQVGIAVVSPPFIGYAINRSQVIPHQ